MRTAAIAWVVFSGLLFGVEGFSVTSSTSRASKSSHLSFRQHRADVSNGRRQQLLFAAENNSERKQSFLRVLRLHILKLYLNARRPLMILAASCMVWCGTGTIKSVPAHASTAATDSATSITKPFKRILSPSLGQMVDRYVKDHMFADDVYEPVESVYREAFNDRVKGVHPKAISEITSSILGQDGLKVEKTSSSSTLGDKLLAAVNFLQRKGISETSAILLLTGSLVVAGPVTFLLIATMAGSQSKRQINSVMKKRYGDTYTVDATVKKEEDVELPDEDDDDDDEDDEDDDDDNDDEDKE